MPSETEQAFFADIASSVHHFSDFFFSDKEEHGFLVPTRMNRITGDAPQFQVDIFKLLDNLQNGKRIALASPRGFTKSTTCSIFFPLYAALMKKFNEILIVSNSESLAVQLIRQIRINLESNENILGVFGKQESAKWTETHLILKNGVSIRGCGWGAQIRGFRPDLIIMDDIESDETVNSEDIRKKMRDWIMRAMINALTPTGCIVFIGTIISRLSILYDFIHHPPEGWESVFNQAYRQGIQEPGYELWPEVWHHDRLQQRKSEIGSWAFSSEFMNDPVPSEGNRFNPSTFRYYEDADLIGKQLGFYVTIDPAFSEVSTADYGVVMQCYHDAEDNLYVDRYFRERTTSGKLISYVKNLYRMNKSRIRAIGVEKNGTQKSFYEEMKREFERDGLYAPFVELGGVVHTAKGAMRTKRDRITYALQPRFEAGKIWLRRSQIELIEELSLYPEVSHDDLSDALAYQFELVPAMMDYSQALYSGSDDLPDTFEHDADVVYSFSRKFASPNHGQTGYGDNYAA